MEFEKLVSESFLDTTPPRPCVLIVGPRYKELLDKLLEDPHLSNEE